MSVQELPKIYGWDANRHIRYRTYRAVEEVAEKDDLFDYSSREGQDRLSRELGIDPKEIRYVPPTPAAEEPPDPEWERIQRVAALVAEEALDIPPEAYDLFDVSICFCGCGRKYLEFRGLSL